MGAEIGNSTQKLHARGPIGLRELTIDEVRRCGAPARSAGERDRVGVLGGAFNPPHLGHLLLAQEAVHELGLDEVILVPTGIAPHKEIEPEPGADVRLEMARLAAEGVDRVSVSDVEVRREGPSFAFRTLELLADALPGSELTFVMGADVAAGLERWKRPRKGHRAGATRDRRAPGIRPLRGGSRRWRGSALPTVPSGSRCRRWASLRR